MGLKQRFRAWFSIGKEQPVGAEIILPTNLPTNLFNPNQPSTVSVATTCVKILAETIGRMPLNVWKVDKSSGKILDKKNYLWDILHNQPNGFTTANSFFQTLEYHRNFRGNAFARIHRVEGSGIVEWLEILSPSRVTGYTIKNNDLYYTIKNDRGDEEAEVNHMNILHFKMMSPDGIWGINPIAALALNMGVVSKGMQSMDSFYENNALSPKAIKHTVGSSNAALSKEAMAAFNEKYGGAYNAGKWINLPPNTEIQDLQINFADAQIIESMKFNSQQIAAMYGVPVYMATGDYTQSKYNNIEQSQLSYKINTVAPIARMYKSELEAKLLTTKDKKKGGEVEFNINSLVEPDTKTKSEYFGKMITTGVMTPQMVATLEGYPITPDQDVHLVMTNLMSLEQYNKRLPEETK